MRPIETCLPSLCSREALPESTDLATKALHAKLRFVIEPTVFVLSQEASEKFLHESGVVAVRQRAHIEAEEECVREFEIREFRIEDGVGEQAIALLFVPAQNDSNILKILG